MTFARQLLTLEYVMFGSIQVPGGLFLANTVFGAFNTGLKKYAPKLQPLLKECIYRSEIPLPKRLWGRLVWTHPKLWNHVLWDGAVLRWMMDYLKPGDVFFDVGAHQGWLSMAAAWKTGQTGKVIAFEPSPALVHFLNFHKKVNRLGQMEVVQKAVTRTESPAASFILEGDGDSVLNSLIEIDVVKTGPRGSTVVSVETTSLDSYSRQTGLIPSMIKIDTEGAEIWACEGAKGILAKHHPALIIATHPSWLPEGQRLNDLFDLLGDYGYRAVASESLQYGEAVFQDYLFLAN